MLLDVELGIKKANTSEKNPKQSAGPRTEPGSKGGVENEGPSWRAIQEKLVESDGIRNSGPHWISGTSC